MAYLADGHEYGIAETINFKQLVEVKIYTYIEEFL